MDVEVLRWFQLVADGTTVTEVSEVHLVSQPSVSRALARLEREVGAPLLQRQGRLLRPTHAGSVFKRYVDAAMSDLDDGLAAVEALLDPESGTVSLAFQLSFGGWLVPRLVASFHRVHPGVRFSFWQTQDAAGAARVADGEVDLEITAQRPSDPDVEWRRILVERLALAVPVGHRLDAGTSLPLAVAAQEDFVVLRPQWALRGLAEELCRAAGFEPRIAYEVDDVATMRGLVAAGLGVAIFPAMGREPGALYAGAVRLLGLTDPRASRDVGLTWSKARRLLPAAEAFRRHVIEEAKAGL